MYTLPERCPFRGLFIPNPIYSTTPYYSNSKHCKLVFLTWNINDRGSEDTQHCPDGA
ncbi:hypothetical protein [Serratia symbiotica]|uniref:hypothetical protein n=1 Tax=Serratia symbiotica TaxID=138074 RepID=UPI0030CEAF14